MKKWQIVPIFKKEDSTKFKNYRATVLLNTDYKLLTSVIKSRLLKYTENELGPYQQGWLFVDFQQAFEGIKREQLIKEMKKINIPGELIKTN